MSKSDIALSVRGLSKAYTISHEQEKHVTLAETMLARLKDPLRRPKTETFWALKNIEFDIKKGDVVGIIGRNGAGKSTLLKILSRITEPTTGRIDLYGRVGSLLEVGTGFHPELTGRENIFLNGAILGMTKAEIKKQFDAIVDFSGVEQFLDTPVKRYSSGMYVRLAFAVAAHLNPEILIVDEVLAVGDAEFQKKCLGKMRDVAEGGRTVLFVSHQLPAVQMLCHTVIFLKSGRLHSIGPVEVGIEEYRLQGVASSDGSVDLSDPKSHMGPGPIRITHCELLHREEKQRLMRNSFLPKEPIGVRVAIHSPSPEAEVTIGYALLHSNGTILFTSHQNDSHSVETSSVDAGETIFETWIDPSPFLPGRYTIQIGVLIKNVNSDFVQEVAHLEIEKIVSPNGFGIDARPGAMRFDFSWSKV